MSRIIRKPPPNASSRWPVVSMYPTDIRITTIDGAWHPEVMHEERLFDEPLTEQDM